MFSERWKHISSLMHLNPALTNVITFLFVLLTPVGGDNSFMLGLPAIAMGTAGLFGRTTEMVCEGLKAGFRLFDTAQAAEWYDEEALGRALLHCPVEDTVVIVTKIHPRYFEAESLRESVSRSRQRLYPDQANRPLDVVLLHAPWCWWEGHCTDEQKTHSWREAWRVLEALRDEGLVKAIGVSNFDAEQLRELLEFSNRKVSVVQNWMDPLHQDRAVRALAADHGIIYMAYSSFGTQWQSKSSILNPVLSEPVLAKIADAHGTSVPQVILSWIVQEGAVPIPRSSQRSHVVDNAAMLRGHTQLLLSEGDMHAIRALDGNPY